MATGAVRPTTSEHNDAATDDNKNGDVNDDFEFNEANLKAVSLKPMTNSKSEMKPDDNDVDVDDGGEDDEADGDEDAESAQSVSVAYLIKF